MTPAQEEWARCRPWLKAAVERSGFYTIEYAEAEVEAGRMIFWPGERGAVLLTLTDYPKGKALALFAVGGEKNASLSELLERFEPALVAFAKQAGCRWVMGFARRGWKKPGERLGYKLNRIVMVKEV